MRVTRIHGRFSLEEYKKIGYSHGTTVDKHTCVSLRGFWVVFHTFPTCWWTPGDDFWKILRIQCVAWFFSDSCTASVFGGCEDVYTLSTCRWTLDPVSELPEECTDEPGKCLCSALLVRQWTPVCVCLLPMFTHFLSESGLAANITPVIQCCTGGLDMDECEQSWAQIPCQFQACLRQERLLVVRTVISNLEAVPGCVVFGRVAGVDGGKSVGHATSG